MSKTCSRNAVTPGRFNICTAHAKIENETVYAAIIVENRNPKLKEITDDFRKTADMLADKPEDTP